MKRLITLSSIIICMSFTALTAQDVKLTIETTAGFLKDSISTELRQTVTDLTLTGSMNDADFYLIRDEMDKLKILNMHHVEVDTIPEMAFYGHKSLWEVTLPAMVKYLNDQSFRTYYFLDVWVSGMFPGLGNDVFTGSAAMNVLPDNEFCRESKGYIISSDTKILYYYHRYSSNYTHVPDGVETIESRSFDKAEIGTVIFPSTVRLVKKNAFSNIDPLWAYSTAELCLNFNTAVPPALEDSAFNDDQFSKFYLWVPQGCIDNYKNDDPQWLKFGKIVDKEPESSINDHVLKSVSLLTGDSGTTIFSEVTISRIEVTSLCGVTLINKEIGSTECFISKTDVQGLCLVKIILDNGSSTVLKINQ